MQAKHLIIIAIAGIVILLGFNIINSNRHEESRIAMMSESATDNDSSSTAGDSKVETQLSINPDIASKPLGEQPKAIIDNATNKIDQAQQADAERLAQLDDAQ